MHEFKAVALGSSAPSMRRARPSEKRPLHRTAEWWSATQNRVHAEQWAILDHNDIAALIGWTSSEELHAPYDVSKILRGEAPALGYSSEVERVLSDMWRGHRQPTGLTFMMPGYNNLFDLGGDAAEMTALASAAIEQGETLGVDMVGVLFLAGVDREHVDLFRRLGYLPLKLFATWRAPTPDVSWAEYTSALPGKRRLNIARDERRLVEQEIEIGMEPAAPLGDELIDGRIRLRSAYGLTSQRDDVSAEFDELVSRFGDRLVTFIARKRGVLVSYAMFIEWGADLTVIWTGRGGEEAHHSYFGSTFYGPLRYALESRRLEFVDFGPGAAEAKRGRGALPLQLSGFVHAGTDTATSMRVERAVRHIEEGSNK